jgi:hypothetical protein
MFLMIDQGYLINALMDDDLMEIAFIFVIMLRFEGLDLIGIF